MYSRAPKLPQRVKMEIDDHTGATKSTSISLIAAKKRLPKPPILAATKWVQSRSPLSVEMEYIKQFQSNVKIICTIDEIDTNPTYSRRLAL